MGGEGGGRESLWAIQAWGYHGVCIACGQHLTKRERASADRARARDPSCCALGPRVLTLCHHSPGHSRLSSEDDETEETRSSHNGNLFYLDSSPVRRAPNKGLANYGDQVRARWQFGPEVLEHTVINRRNPPTPPETIDPDSLGLHPEASIVPLRVPL